jgi:hypothetical protein
MAKTHRHAAVRSALAKVVSNWEKHTADVLPDPPAPRKQPAEVF